MGKKNKRKNPTTLVKKTQPTQVEEMTIFMNKVKKILMVTGLSFGALMASVAGYEKMTTNPSDGVKMQGRYDAPGGEIFKPSKKTEKLLKEIWQNVVLFKPADENEIGPKSEQEQIIVAILGKVLEYPEGREIFKDLQKEGVKFYFTFDWDTDRNSKYMGGYDDYGTLALSAPAILHYLSKDKEGCFQKISSWVIHELVHIKNNEHKEGGALFPIPKERVMITMYDEIEAHMIQEKIYPRESSILSKEGFEKFLRDYQDELEMNTHFSVQTISLVPFEKVKQKRLKQLNLPKWMQERIEQESEKITANWSQKNLENGDVVCTFDTAGQMVSSGSCIERKISKQGKHTIITDTNETVTVIIGHPSSQKGILDMLSDVLDNDPVKTAVFEFDEHGKLQEITETFTNGENKVHQIDANGKKIPSTKPVKVAEHPQKGNKRGSNEQK